MKTKLIISGLIAGILTFGVYLSAHAFTIQELFPWYGGQQVFGGFNDGFKSIQLAPSPSNGNCLKTDGTDNLWASCGGGGSGGGTWSTSTPTNTSYDINYPIETDDVVVIGDDTATSSAEFYFDPNIRFAQIQDRLKIGNNYVATTTTVCSYGCDYTSIDTAVDTVPASTTILIKNGTYALGAGTITVTAGKTLEILGESMDGVQITYSGSGNAFTIGASTDDTRRFRLENVTIIGTSNGTRGLSLVRVKNSTFRNIRVIGFSSDANPGQGIRLDGTGGSTIDNYFYNLHCDTSEFCLNLSGTAVNSNHFYGFNLRPDSTGNAISLANANGNSFHGGLVGNATQGFDFNSTGDENLVIGTYCEDNTTCIVFDSGAADNSVSVIDVETNDVLVTDAGTQNNFSAVGDNARTFFNSGPFLIGKSASTTPNSVFEVAGTSTMTSPLELGTTAASDGNQKLRVTAAGNASASDSVGGLVRLTNTLNSGSALGIYSNFGASAANDLMVIQSDNAAYDRRAFRIKQDGTGGAGLFDCLATSGTRSCLEVTSTDLVNSTLGVTGSSTDHSILKVLGNDNDNTDGNASNADSAVVGAFGHDANIGLFISGSDSITSLGSTTGDAIQFRNFDNQSPFRLKYDGRMGLWDFTPDAMLEIVATTSNSLGTGTILPAFYVSSSAAGDGDIFKIGAGGATTTSFFATTASTTNFFGAGLSSCTSNNVLTWTGGQFGCEADDGAGGGIAITDIFTLNGSWISTTTPTGWFASTTIGAGTAATGLTINGGATTTGSLKIQGHEIYDNALGGLDFRTTGVTDVFGYDTNSVDAFLAFTAPTVDTGQGANELYDMDQNVLTTSNVIFANATTTNLFSTTASSTNLFASVVNFGQSIFSLVQQTVTALGVWDFGGATSVELPNGTGPTVDATGETAVDTTDDQFTFFGGSAKRVLSPFRNPVFSYSTTTWAGTTTLPLGPAFEAETWVGIKCFTDTGTLNVSINDGTNRADLLNASTTVGNFTFSTNNTFTASEKRYVDIGTPASSPKQISCTAKKTIDAL